ncbi:hypothetical protein ACFQ05_26440 [Amycolatopsis umgeniensis]|uniref:Uncharacterized protein n=1 Tax=Amycolatopsis umgeniensis TaxID=336628 RepID=A0A841BBY9_9PSEU|nr:hypothetical protein [Amycolatopsis umgeniensis]MBB5856421.1 hypothetical protein [Amycolatopsis umgeniensis]
MADTTIATVGELIAALDQYDPATSVRLATPPDIGASVCDSLEYPLAQVLFAQDDTSQPVVWLCVVDHMGYLPEPVGAALGWS